MSACTTASGGVFFIPQTVSRKKQSVSYADFIAEENLSQECFVFGKRKPLLLPEEELESKTA